MSKQNSKTQKTGVIVFLMMISILSFVMSSCNKEDYLQNAGNTENYTQAEADSNVPEVPANLQVPEGNKLSYHVFASGVQIYRCDGTSWVFVAPEATLYANSGYNGEVGTHYAGPRWESNSGSIVRGAVDQSAPSPDPNSVAWLLLHSAENSGSGIFADVTYIQRVNTSGGKAPLTGCDPLNIGTEIRVPYTAEYYFYKAEN